MTDGKGVIKAERKLPKRKGGPLWKTDERGLTLTDDLKTGPGTRSEAEQ